MARAEHRLVLAAVHVDLSVWEIGQAAGVVEVEVGHYDVLDRCGAVPEASTPAHGGVFGVVHNAEAEAKVVY